MTTEKGQTDSGQIGLILNEYPIRPLRVRLVAQHDNDVFRVDAEEGVFALRHHRLGASQVQVASELAWLEHASRTLGSRIPKPVRRRDSGLVSEVNGRAVSLLAWVPGRSPLKPTAALAKEIGRTLGQLHLLNESFQAPEGFAMRRWDASDLFGPAWLKRLERTFGLMTTESQSLIRRRAAAVRSAFPTERVGVLHGDFIGSNCLWQQGTLGVIDFANSGMGPYAYDLAVAIRHLPPPLRNDTIKGYRSTFTLSESDTEALPALIQARMLNMVSYAADRIDDPGPTYDPVKLVNHAIESLRREAEI